MKKACHAFPAVLVCTAVAFCITAESVKAAWEKDETGWRYSDETGYKKSNWFQDIDEKWYYFNENGYMKTGWFQDINEKWYYFDESGFMRTGWIQDKNGKYYYLNPSGDMAYNTIIDGIYQLGADGAWIEKNEEKQEVQNTLITYTAEDIKNKNLSSYTAGTESVYGPKLT